MYSSVLAVNCLQHQIINLMLNFFKYFICDKSNNKKDNWRWLLVEIFFEVVVGVVVAVVVLSSPSPWPSTVFSYQNITPKQLIHKKSRPHAYFDGKTNSFKKKSYFVCPVKKLAETWKRLLKQFARQLNVHDFCTDKKATYFQNAFENRKMKVIYLFVFYTILKNIEFLPCKLSFCSFNVVHTSLSLKVATSAFNFIFSISSFNFIWLWLLNRN